MRRRPKAKARMDELVVEEAVEPEAPEPAAAAGGGVRSQLPPAVKAQPVAVAQAPQAPVEVIMLPLVQAIHLLPAEALQRASAAHLPATRVAPLVPSQVKQAVAEQVPQLAP